MVTSTQIVGIGDLHLRSAHPRNNQRLRAFDQAIQAGLSLPRLGAWVVAGDVFDTKSTVDDRNAVAERLLLMASRAPVLIPRGNHDAAGDLLIFSKLGTVWPVIVRESPEVVSVMLATGESALVFLLPWPSEDGLVGQGVAPSDVCDVARGMLDAIFMEAAARLAAAREAGEITLFAGHVNVRGAVASTGQPQIGLSMEIDTSALARLGHCPKLLGHIHKPQDVGSGLYIGSNAHNDFGEVEDKRFVIVDFTDDGREWTVYSHRLDVPAMYHVEGWLTRDQAFTYDVKRGPDGDVLAKPDSWRGCEVRARLRFKQAEKGMLEFAKAPVLAEFAEAARFELELVAVPDSGVRAPAVAAARTLPEKVTAWAQETTTVLPDMALTVLATLEHGDADAVVRNERAGMDLLLNPPVEDEQKAQAVA